MKASAGGAGGRGPGAWGGAAYARPVLSVGAALGSASRVLAVLAATAAVVAAASFAGGYSYRRLAEVAPPRAAALAAVAVRPGAPARLERRIAGQVPAGLYVAIDTTGNRLYLKRGEQVLLSAPCSTGTGGVLTDPASGRRWVFETPRGAYHVLAKAKDPVWHKPDWAFVEEGKPIPRDPRQRMDTYSLGSYALSLGDGYLIHGTLYQRLIGRSATHGCVRLGDADLEAVYRAVAVGTPVFIY
jgi:lipoprotein-anchoring transpeptidase ErfK/SrfK